MNKVIKVLGITMLFFVGMATTVYAKGSVEFTGSNELKLSSTDLGTEFNHMAPGETKTQSVTIINSNQNTTDFYMKTEALKKLEEAHQASGGAYKITLELVKDGASTSIYDSSLGGAKTGESGDIKADTQGILGLNTSEIATGSTFLATLKNGQTAELKLTVGLDGESIRNAAQNTYANAEGTLGLEFLAAYREPATGQIVKVNKVETQSSTPQRNIVQTFKQVVIGVKTGDSTMVGVFVGILVTGITLVVLTGKKKKTEEPL